MLLLFFAFFSLNMLFHKSGTASWSCTHLQHQNRIMGKSPRGGRRSGIQPARPWHHAFWPILYHVHCSIVAVPAGCSLSVLIPTIQPPPLQDILRPLENPLATNISIGNRIAVDAQSEPRLALHGGGTPNRLGSRGWLQRGNAAGQRWLGMASRSSNVTTAALHKSIARPSRPFAYQSISRARKDQPRYLTDLKPLCSPAE